MKLISGLYHQPSYRSHPFVAGKDALLEDWVLPQTLCRLQHRGQGIDLENVSQSLEKVSEGASVQHVQATV
jgi:hypothetical protein